MRIFLFLSIFIGNLVLSLSLKVQAQWADDCDCKFNTSVSDSQLWMEPFKKKLSFQSSGFNSIDSEVCKPQAETAKKSVLRMILILQAKIKSSQMMKIKN